MKLTVNLNRLSPPARALLRLAADRQVSLTKFQHAARILAGEDQEFEEKAAARAEGSVRSKLRGRRFVISTLEEAQALQGIMDMAVRGLEDVAQPGSTLPAEREIHRFARSLHLANILEMEEDAA